MTQEIEIEFKNLLTKDEFDQLIHYYNIMEKHFFTQKNIYFDTPSMCLKQHHSAIRIRIKSNFIVLTLKQQTSEGMLETHQQLSQSQYEDVITSGAVPEGQIRSIIMSLCHNTTVLRLLGELTTHRAETPYINGTLVFDYSTYLNQTDYELEYEVSDYHQGQLVFNQLLHNQHIPHRKTKNKIARLFDAIQNITRDANR